MLPNDTLQARWDEPAPDKMKRGAFYFFIGTVAEFIKLMPVMRELSKAGTPFKVIASGQNPLTCTDLFSMSGVEQIDITLNQKPIKRSALGLLSWFLETLVKGFLLLRREFRGMGKGSTLVVHGDTVSTVMGALIGRCCGLTVAHVEAGLRSFNLTQPFPEEIDRCLTSYLADIHFCPYEMAISNLRKRKGIKVDTCYNTNIDSLLLALSQGKKPSLMEAVKGKYFIFIMHRQENLLNRALVREIIQAILEEAQHIKCVFVMHELTRSVLRQLGLLIEIEGDDNVIIAERLPYFEFVALLSDSEFVVTDGGGNQQECYYLGKPCLLLRNVTEGNEGLGHNVLVSKNELSVIRAFMANYTSYAKPIIRPEVRPSQIIASVLLNSDK